jgi:hypothetical protein
VNPEAPPRNNEHRSGLQPSRRSIRLVPQPEYRSSALSASVTRLDDSAVTDAQRFVSAILEKSRTSPGRFDSALRQAAHVCRLVALELEARASS